MPEPHGKKSIPQDCTVWHVACIESTLNSGAVFKIGFWADNVFTSNPPSFVPAVKQEKETKEFQLDKEDIKLLLFADAAIIYREDPKDFI